MHSLPQRRRPMRHARRWIGGGLLALFCVGHAASVRAQPTTASEPAANDGQRGRDDRRDGGSRDGGRDVGRDGGRDGATSRESFYRGMSGGIFGRGGGPGGSGGGGAPNREPSEEEWTEILTFMEENSPFRLTLFRRIEAEAKDAPVVGYARRRIANRYFYLEDLKRRRDTELYDFALRQYKSEDRVMGMIGDAQRDNPPPDLNGKIDEAVAEFVANHLAEREARLKRLRDLVAKESDALANDRTHVADLVRNQRDRFENEYTRLSKLPGADRDDPAPPPSPSVPPAASQPTVDARVQ